MSLVFLCVRNLHAEHVRNQNGQINCKIILIYICIFFLNLQLLFPLPAVQVIHCVLLCPTV